MKNKKNIILSSAENAQRVVKVKGYPVAEDPDGTQNDPIWNKLISLRAEPFTEVALCVGNQKCYLPCVKRCGKSTKCVQSS